MANEQSHLLYYLGQEKKRDEIMQHKLESQKKRFSDYMFKEIRSKHFIVFEKEKFTEEDEMNGMSYRIDFYVGNTTCSIFTNSTSLDKAIKEVYERFAK